MAHKRKNLSKNEEDDLPLACVAVSENPDAIMPPNFWVKVENVSMI